MKSKGKGTYKHETEAPSVPASGHQMSGMGCHEFKGQAADISYGQAGKSGCSSDEKKIMGQMKHYHWESADNY